MAVFIVATVVFFINIPFGYWRATVRKFSMQWFLAIHLPIPFVILLRYYFEIGYDIYTYPIFIISFLVGQYIGKLLFRGCKSKNAEASL